MKSPIYCQSASLTPVPYLVYQFLCLATLTTQHTITPAKGYTFTSPETRAFLSHFPYVLSPQWTIKEITERR